MFSGQDKIGIAIVGGTGYGAAELLRLCALHPALEVVSVVSASSPGVEIASVHPHLKSLYTQEFSAEVDFTSLANYSRCAVLLALPHKTAASYTRKIKANLDKVNAVLFDLSGDFRLRDSEIREKYYPGVSDLEQSSVAYGLPELNRDKIATANAISTPGCLATVVTLAALPLFKSTIRIIGSIVADAKTGSSGAGRSLRQEFHHPSRHDDANPYNALVHRHEPEILQNWYFDADQSKPFMFVPHLIPCSRGCMASVYLEIDTKIPSTEVHELFVDFYDDKPAVRVGSQMPHLSHVVGTNYCDVSVVVRDSQVVCFAALDNLVKGAGGQMIQNLNIRFGFDELLGLSSPALGPC
ncbi:UNVERIFIED_CONTAM: hypothetical protein GTU68_006017 [Idotea baltica]|nr:hypothetical protein [Idotea baltica]